MAEGWLRSRNAELFEQAQRAQAARDIFAEVYDNASEALLSVSSPGLIRTANLAAAELFDRERTRLIGRPLRLFVHQDDRVELARVFSQASAETISTIDVRLHARHAMTTCRLDLRRSEERPDITYLLLLPRQAADGRR